MRPRVDDDGQELLVGERRCLRSGDEVDAELFQLKTRLVERLHEGSTLPVQGPNLLPLTALVAVHRRDRPAFRVRGPVDLSHGLTSRVFSAVFARRSSVQAGRFLKQATLPSAVRGPVDFSQGLTRRMTLAARARRSGVQGPATVA